MKLPAGNAVRISYGSNSEPNPVTNKAIRLENDRYYFWKDGKLVSLDLSAPCGRRQRRSMDDDGPQLSLAVTMATIAADDVYRFYHTRYEETRALRGVTFALSPESSSRWLVPRAAANPRSLPAWPASMSPTAVRSSFLGEPIARLSEDERAVRRRRHIGILMQSRNLLPGPDGRREHAASHADGRYARRGARRHAARCGRRESPPRRLAG